MPVDDLRWGFKTECNTWARELREELGLEPHDPLCPWKLCEHLEVPVLDLRQLEPCPEQAYLLSRVGQKAFSGAVLYEGLRASVLINGAHSRKRLASSLAHEVAHVVLHHPPRPLFVAGGRRSFSPEHEAEAEWLGPALLVSEEAALRAYQLIQAGAATLAQLSDRWAITQQVIRMRINVTGAAKRHLRSA